MKICNPSGKIHESGEQLLRLAAAATEESGANGR